MMLHALYAHFNAFYITHVMNNYVTVQVEENIQLSKSEDTFYLCACNDCITLFMQVISLILLSLLVRSYTHVTIHAS